MKVTELKKVLKETVREVIQEELKDILLEAVKSQNSTPIVENKVVQPTQPNLEAQKAARASIMQTMMGGNPLTTQNTFNPQGTMPGGDLPAGNVGLDQIMGLMNNK